MNDQFTKQKVINHEHDYSNHVPTIEAVSYLVQYCDQLNKQLTKLIEEEEEKNKQFKPEYREYNYKKSYYGQQLEVYIREKTFRNITCKDYESFLSAVQNENLKQVSGLDIKLYLHFQRGRGTKLESCENTFSVLFRPYEITVVRMSNYEDFNMDNIEKQINQILEQFPVMNSIFCDKE